MTTEHLYICFSLRYPSLVLFAYRRDHLRASGQGEQPSVFARLPPRDCSKNSMHKREEAERRQRVLWMLFCPLQRWRTKITLHVTIMGIIVTIWKEKDNIDLFGKEGVNTDENTQANQCTAEDEMLPLSILKHYYIRPVQHQCLDVCLFLWPRYGNTVLLTVSYWI